MHFASIAKERSLYLPVPTIKSYDCYKAGVAQYNAIFGLHTYGPKCLSVYANTCNINSKAF